MTEKKRGITSREIFRNLGYNPEEALPASWTDLSNIPDGQLIMEQDVTTVGFLAQYKQTGAVVFINKNNKKQEIWSKEILDSKFKGVTIFPKDASEINSYSNGQPVKFANGEIVTSPGSNAVYLIDKGKKRPFVSAKAFNKLGYKWENVIHTTDQVLKLHDKGKPVKLPSTKKKKTKK
ncbi:MAG: hypothetical protein V1898_04295 [Patescibacteria group bacterium]